MTEWESHETDWKSPDEVGFLRIHSFTFLCGVVLKAATVVPAGSGSPWSPRWREYILYFAWRWAMNLRKVTVELDVNQVREVLAIDMDDDAERALSFIKEHLARQVKKCLQPH